MSQKGIPTSADGFYRKFIDKLVKDTKCPSADLILKGKYSNQADAGPQNTFVESLTLEQRQLLIEMLENERTHAFHSVLADLAWWVTCHGLELRYRGKPAVPYEGFHQDYIGRLSGDWPWPKSRT